jgi:transcription termination factor Rho
MDEEYESILKVKREYEDKKKIKYKEDSKDRLKKIFRKKIQTTMIGALDTIEKNLGFLWEDDTQQSKQLKEIYDVVRQEILDRGNDQMRNMDAELNQYEVEWLRYRLTIPVKRRD